MNITTLHKCISAAITCNLLLACLSNNASGQTQNNLKLFLSADSSKFVQFSFANQTWVRYTENNPGSAVGGTHQNQMENSTLDIGLRRTRMQFIGKLNRHFMMYAQFGQNNFNYISARKSGFFIHDALGEININKHIEIGAGLSAWTGFSRFSSPAVASIMGLDAPLFLQATNDANDQFLRKLSVYAKGKIMRLDYRLVLSKPMDFVYSSLYKTNNLSADALFAPTPPKPQFSTYLSYQFMDQESNLTPYQVGTYLGKKKVFNIGGGIEYQPEAMWYKKTVDDDIDTIYHDMLLTALDIYYDAPINAERGNTISIYAAVTYYDFGPHYLRNIGVMNTTDSLKFSQASFNGTGVNFPMIGTGMSAYMQIGYLSGKLFSTKNNTRIMPYAAIQISNYEKLDDKMAFFDLGCSLYIDDSRSKLTFGIQNRPIYQISEIDPSIIRVSKRLNSFILQYQVSI
jgi:hypothetical protein